MRKVISISASGLLLASCLTAQQLPVPDKTGESKLEWTFSKSNVQVTFDARQVKSSDAAYPVGIEHYKENRPVRIIHSLRISVNGQAVRVLSSVWRGLFDVGRCDLEQAKDGTYVLHMVGADGGYGYDVYAYFNRAAVWKKAVYAVGPADDDSPAEVTYYHLFR